MRHRARQRDQDMGRPGKPSRRAGTLHANGVGANAPPRVARQRRELNRLVSEVRRVLWRTPTRLVLWVERDVRKARAHGNGFFSFSRLDRPYQGSVLGMGPRAILTLRGGAPA